MNPRTLPFQDVLCFNEQPRTLDRSGLLQVKTPLYSQVPGFSFDLSNLFTTPETNHLMLNPNDLDSRAGCIEKMIQSASFDRAQSIAMIKALSSEFACIQGPPVICN